jgi:hypothetical protein
MNQIVKLSARTAVAAAVLSLGGTAFAAVAFDANLELDNTYHSGSYTEATGRGSNADRGLTQGGRVELNAASKAGANMFVAARASFLAKKDGSVGTDDMWVQVGNSKGDVKLGRFEGADLFPLAQDTLVSHAGSVYGTNALRGRKGNNEFHAAGTMNLGGGLSVEVGAIESRIAGAAKGLRPGLSYAAGPLTARLGVEAGKYYGTNNDVAGVGATVGYNFGGFTLTGNIASGKADRASRNNMTSLGLTAAMGSLVVGLVTANNENATAGVSDDTVQTVYASYSMPLFDIKGATVTPALSASTGKVAGVSQDDVGLRLRFNYAF